MSLSSLEMLRYDYQEDSSNGRKFGISAVLLPFWDVMEKPMLYKVSKYSLKKLRGDLQTLVMVSVRTICVNMLFSTSLRLPATL